MGLKSLTLQMVPVCLHVSIRPEDDHPAPTPTPTPAVVRLIHSDGRIRIFRRSIPASEIMSSNPHHLICRGNNLLVGEKVPPLAAGDLLLPGESYLLFPSTFFSSPLTFSSLASLASSSKLMLLRPFEVKKTCEGRLQLRVSDEFVERLGEEEEEEVRVRVRVRVCTTVEMEREYRELVVRARVWKPKLETIREGKEKRKVKKKQCKEQRKELTDLPRKHFS